MEIKSITAVSSRTESVTWHMMREFYRMYAVLGYMIYDKEIFFNRMYAVLACVLFTYALCEL